MEYCNKASLLPPPLHPCPPLVCSPQVMEYCDKASLRHAMKKGVFHKRLDNTSVAVDLCAIVQVGAGVQKGTEGAEGVFTLCHLP